MAAREGFRLVQEEPECTNVCFWYVPPSMRGQPETPEWWARLSKVRENMASFSPVRERNMKCTSRSIEFFPQQVAPEIKARMVKAGTMMVGYQPMSCKQLVNFFRMITTCTPVPTSADMDYVLTTIDTLGADL